MRRPRKNARSEPRITRDMLKSNKYVTSSAPTTPSQVILTERQNLEQILRPRNPILPEVVNMDANTVQTVTQALSDPEIQAVRERQSRLRPQNKVDYAMLHRSGRKK